jgi:hypothetical protein
MIFADIFEYTTNVADLKQQFKKLALKYHPDRGGTTEEFQQLKVAFEKANDAISNKNIWIGSNVVYLPINNKVLKFHYNFKHETEYNCLFSNQKYLVIIFKHDQIDLTEIAIENLNFVRSKKLEKYPSHPGLKKTIELIPNIHLPGTDIKNGIITILLPSNVFPLTKVLEQYKNKYGGFEIPHATWMTGRLLNFLCFLEVLELVHGGISIDNIWVDLEKHNLYFFGGWEFSRKHGEKLIALPGNAAKFVIGNIAKYQLTSEVVRDIILSLFQNKKEEIRTRKDIPIQIIEFLIVPFGNDAIAAYKTWEKLRDSSWERKFVKFNYQPEKLK